MPANIEIKARVSDPATLLANARALTSTEPEIILQTDTFFQAETGRLKVREFADGTGELISYHRADAAGPKTSSYAISRTEDAGALLDVLAAVLPKRGVVRKKRLLLLSGRTRIHLDEVEGLGSFMELEVVLADGDDQDGGEKEAAELMAGLGITSGDLVSGAYIDLLDEKKGPS